MPIILDGKRLSEDDDGDDNESKQFVVEEMVPLPTGDSQLDVVIVFQCLSNISGAYICSICRIHQTFIFCCSIWNKTSTAESSMVNTLYNLYMYSYGRPKYLS